MRKTIAIIGDGIASLAGVYNIAHKLLTTPNVVLAIEVIGPSAGTRDWGKGPAYSSPGKLNVATEHMGFTSLSLKDKVHPWMTADGFLNWLTDNKGYPTLLRGEKGERLRQEAEKYRELSEQGKFKTGTYLPRRLEGLYIEAIQEIVKEEASKKGVSLHFHQQRAVDINKAPCKVILQDGEKIPVDMVLDATGNASLLSPIPGSENLQAKDSVVQNPWTDLPNSIRQGRGVVVIFGTGPTFVDKVKELDEAEHFEHGGKVIAISNHAFMPLPHATEKAELPKAFLAELHKFATKPEISASEFKQFVEKHIIRENIDRSIILDKNGISDLKDCWQEIMVKIRDRHQEIWEKFPETEKKIFFERYFGWWKPLRNRMVPEDYLRLNTLIEKGDLILQSGRIIHVRECDNRNFTVYYKINIQGSLSAFGDMIKLDGIQSVINCTGPSRNIERQEFHKNLLEKHLVQEGPAGIGIRLNRDKGDGFSAAGSGGIIFPLSGERLVGEKFEINGWQDSRKWNEQLAEYVVNKLGIFSSAFL